jgi:hypothetical protein
VRARGEDDYDVVDETRIRRIYGERIHGDFKWLWFQQIDPAPPPNHGIADTLDEAKVRSPGVTRRSSRGNDGPLGACPSIRWISLASEGRIRFCLGA